jgi:hypothetical protein
MKHSSFLKVLEDCCTILVTGSNVEMNHTKLHRRNTAVIPLRERQRLSAAEVGKP